MHVVWFDLLAGLCSSLQLGNAKGAINEKFFNRTQNDVIWGLIALFLTNHNAGNTIDFKMNVINEIIERL